MIEIIDPKLVSSEVSDNKRYGKFVWEPLERGYGITLGNSLRRVLLSSLQGAAVIGVKIEGVLHEFTTIPGVREDVADIILNIKGLCMKVHPYESEYKVLHIHSSGEQEVTANDIEVDSDVEILNPELHIATLDKDASLNMDIYIDVGRGYVPSDKNKRDDMGIGWIPVDSIYSPITRVKFGVTDTRVGNVTDYDKLTLEVWTDGSINPDDAISRASGILIEYLNLFQNGTVIEQPIPGPAAVSEPPEPEPDPKLAMSIEEMDLSVRSNNCLRRAGINTVGDLINRSEDDLKKVRNLGTKSLEEIIKKLIDLDLSLRKDDEE
ncbi:MAG: DNA-directed RNA polymerase subunit alpha [Acidaminococcaceae bacterium]|jgi:DNA-directed RNA polymerase subunit alpha|uniref:DNA-directed RNA polymerase subunit alpha n=1 Tax=Succiniclasticum sp. TaxID=2775030 RepID=UPI001B21CD42|nr:DNA-directed RNA polymerase subunit alpha [Succiniclasticum sp.]MBO5591115.1 DNA-directed RNA polymerase subunit alpha [Acidaminococcaceae bacterium]MBO5637274.1 DNA-directed RNA polymerase subunit alpha [Acidaminococcaceae bacterium]MBP3812070.1 DNA-directed RNA polymerase subunit alpha [Acidaminococcaceae bacterium]MBR1494516.1 DNA-directed RNA polymerase subunit alpha [Acidaminococcaceae bacterium]MBR1661872.1 DNA-directed RNA polymerase subunit alpha [Acidaminococcaceae bacterium]